MPEDLSDAGDVLAARLAAIGIDPESDEPLNLPSAASASDSTDADDLVAQTIKAGEQEEETPEPAQPPAATPPAAATTDGEPAEPASAPPPVMAYLRDEYGVDFSNKYRSDEAFLQGILNLNRKIGERDEEAQLGRVLKEDPARVAQWLMQHQPQLFPKPEPQAQQQPAAKPTENGEFDPKWIAALQLKSDVDPATKQALTDWITNQQLMHTPVGRELKELRARVSEIDQLKAMLAQGVHQQSGVDVDGKLAAFQQEQAAKEFVNANPWLFSETNGVRVLSPEGFVYKQALEKAHQGGATFEMAKEYADLALAKHRSSKAPAANGKPSPTKSPAAARTPAAAVPTPDDDGFDWAPDGMDMNEAIVRNLKKQGIYDAYAALYS